MGAHQCFLCEKPGALFSNTREVREQVRPFMDSEPVSSPSKKERPLHYVRRVWSQYAKELGFHLDQSVPDWYCGYRGVKGYLFRRPASKLDAESNMMCLMTRMNYVLDTGRGLDPTTVAHVKYHTPRLLPTFLERRTLFDYEEREYCLCSTSGTDYTVCHRLDSKSLARAMLRTCRMFVQLCHQSMLARYRS